MLRKSKDEAVAKLVERLKQLEQAQRDPKSRSWRNHLRLLKIKRNLTAYRKDKK